MIIKLEHIGVAVKDLKKSNALIADILGKEPYKEEEVQSENVITSFFDCENVKLELLASDKEDSAISKFIAKRGEGIHHLAFEVDDIKEAYIHYEEKGYRILNDSPKQGADGKLIFFMHPKDTNGILIEICQQIKEKEEEKEKEKVQKEQSNSESPEKEL